MFLALDCCLYIALTCGAVHACVYFNRRLSSLCVCVCESKYKVNTSLDKGVKGVKGVFREGGEGARVCVSR